MMKGWLEGVLGDVCITTQGIQIPKSQQKPVLLPGYRRYLYISDFKHNKKLKYVKDVHPNKLISDKDLIVSNTGSAGEIFRGIDGILSNNLFRISFDENVVDKDFLYYFIKSSTFLKLQSQIMRGTANPHMGHKNFKLTPFSYPQLEEQKRIVGMLDETFAGIDQAIANTEKNIQNARDLFESYLNNIFTQKGDGWVEKKLNETCEITAKLIDPKEETFLDLPHIGAGNMLSQSDELVDIQTAREEGLISGKFVFEKGVVLYSKIRPYLMKVCRPDFTGMCSADVYPLMPIKGILERDFLFYMLLSKDFTDYAIKGSARAGMPKVNRTHLFDYATHIPSVEKQRKLTVQIDKVYVASTQTETIYKQKLVALRELKQSLLQKAFSGELTSDKQEAA